MDGNSFYDLDYLIKINEGRADQYLTGYQKVVDRLTNIIIVYSAIPIVQDVFFKNNHSPLLYGCFGLFVVLFLVSLIYTVLLIIPVKVAYLDAPEKYYKTFRLQYEQDKTLDQAAVDQLIKGSYILELEQAVNTNSRVFKRKSSFFYNSILFGLLAAIPYLICLGYHISVSQDSIQKVKLVNEQKNTTLDKSILKCQNNQNLTRKNH
jgi:hypothetical protein